jgi:hypothetical protein
MRRMLGAPLGGTTRGGQYGVESRALSLITPPNFPGGAGSCSPLIVVVALGEPGVPVISWAGAGNATNIAAPDASKGKRQIVPNLWRPRSLERTFGAFMWLVV